MIRGSIAFILVSCFLLGQDGVRSLGQESGSRLNREPIKIRRAQLNQSRDQQDNLNDEYRLQEESDDIERSEEAVLDDSDSEVFVTRPKKTRATTAAFDRSLLSNSPSEPTQTAERLAPANPGRTNQRSINSSRETTPQSSPESIEQSSEVYEEELAGSYESVNAGYEYEPEGYGNFYEGAPNVYYADSYGLSPLALLSRRLYLRAEATNFWATGQSLPLLVTGGATGNTDSLFGGRQIGSDTTQGIRFDAGLWFDDYKIRGVLLRGFDVGDNDLSLNTSSANTPFLARPFRNLTTGANQDPFTISSPNIQSGNVTANVSSKVNGGDVLFRRVIARDHLVRWDWLMGYQTARLTESLDVSSSSVVVTAIGALPQNTTINQTDSFRVKSQFHGAAFGVSGQASEGNWFFGGLFKLGVGNMERQVTIAGTQTIAQPNQAPVTDSQGLLARNTNNGFFKNDTSVIVPELGLTVGYRLTRRLDFTVGYTLIQLPKVTRVIDSLDRELGADLDPVPTVSRPEFTFRESNLTLHGLNLGLQWMY